MSAHYLPVHVPERPTEFQSFTPPQPTDRLSRIERDVTDRNAVSNALAVTQRSPGWNNRKPDIHRVRMGACTLLAVPYRRWAWRRYELRIAEARCQEA